MIIELSMAAAVSIYFCQGLSGVQITEEMMAVKAKD